MARPLKRNNKNQLAESAQSNKCKQTCRPSKNKERGNNKKRKKFRLNDGIFVHLIE